MSAGRPLAVAVLASGRGSNLQALLDEARRHPALLEVRIVLSDRGDAAALQRAARAGVTAEHIAPADFPDRAHYGAALLQRLAQLDVDLVALAGFMRVLEGPIVERFHGRMLNIHPALLPRHPGLDTHRRVLAAGDTEHGATVHFVTARVDAGAPILQYRIGVHPWDRADTLAARVLAGEHCIYPRVLRWFAQRRLEFDGDRARFDGAALEVPLVLTADGIRRAAGSHRADPDTCHRDRDS